ncbi:MAG: ligand-binding sensor domain-containing protein, partial [Bacteroidales bacterium]
MRGLVGIAVFWISIPLAAQIADIRFSRLDINTGLSQNHVNCIYKDTIGFIWIGTMAGLNRYDGNTFKIYKYSATDTTSLSDNFVTSIVQAADGKIWIGTRNGFNIFDPRTEIFYHRLPAELQNSPLQLNQIVSVFGDANKNIWFITDASGLIFYQPLLKKWIPICHRKNDPASLYDNSVTTMTQDNKGNYWCINRKGMLEQIDA